MTTEIEMEVRSAHEPRNRVGSRELVRSLRVSICSKTGHWFSNMDVLIFSIKTNELNRDMTATIRCRCCGETFVHKDAPNAEPNNFDQPTPAENKKTK
jgi:hypothetical protein